MMTIANTSLAGRASRRPEPEHRRAFLADSAANLGALLAVRMYKASPLCKSALAKGGREAVAYSRAAFMRSSPNRRTV